MLERRRLADGVTALVSTTMEADGFLVAFTERTGGCSSSPYESLNLGYSTEDRPANVSANRDRVRLALGLPPFTFGHQVHGARLSRVGAGRAGAGYADPARTLAATDAMVTALAGVALAVLTADCVPVALADPRAGLLAVVHAGWRGIAAGVLQRAVGTFPDPPEVRAAIGPAVGPDHYEVSEEVAAEVAAGAAGRAIVHRDGAGARPRLDLPGTARRVLETAGILRIELSESCTACEPARYFSHRRDGPTGRQALVAGRLA
jgi:polyphenol oxidase